MHVLERSAKAGLVVLAVVLARLLLSRRPKALVCGLWAVVLLRLLCPAFPRAPFGLVPELPIPLPGRLAGPLGWVWLLGTVSMLTYGLAASLVLRRKLRRADPAGEGVFVSGAVTAPFTLGILRPKIYLPEGLDPRETKFVLLHERRHIRRLDHVTKPIGFLALCLHWFNPLVWLAFCLASTDMEMRCDEAVVRALGEDARAEYAEFLLSMTAARGPFGGLALRFGGGDTARRIKNMKSRRQQPLWLTVPAALLCLALAGCLLTDRGETREQSLDYQRDLYDQIQGQKVCFDPEGQTLYYFVDVAGRTDRILHFLDLKTGISMPLCGKPECSHKTSACNAWTSDGCNVQFYGGKIWFTDAGATYRVDPDGNNREEVNSLSLEQMFYGGGHNGRVFLHRGLEITGRPLTEISQGRSQQGIEVYVLPLDGSAREPEIVRVWYPNMALMEDFQPAGDWFYILLKTENMETYNGFGQGLYELRILRWSLSEGTLETVWDKTVDGPYLSCIRAEEESILFTGEIDPGESQSTGLYELDLTTGELREQARLDVGSDDVYLYDDCLVSIGYAESGGQTMRPVTVMDLEGNVTASGTLTDPVPPGMDPEAPFRTFSSRGVFDGWLYVEYGCMDLGQLPAQNSRIFARMDLSTGETELLGDWVEDIK